MSDWKNSLRYIPDSKYYAITQHREVSALLKEAITLLDASQKDALDLGCGAGSETKFLLENSFKVTAVDGNQDAAKYITQLPNNQLAQFIHSDFEDFVFSDYDLVNASRALSFTHIDRFDSVLTKLIASIRPGGIFVGDLYGINDQWNKPEETMTFVDKQQVITLLSGMEILALQEVDKMGTLANGTPKHINQFLFMARKS